LNKAAASAAQFTKFILLHAYQLIQVQLTAQTKTSYSLFNKLT